MSIKKSKKENQNLNSVLFKQNENDLTEQQNQLDENKSLVEAKENENPMEMFRKMLPVNHNAADKQKIELYDKLIDQYEVIQKNNEELEKRISIYIEKNENLLNEINLLKQSNKNNTDNTDNNNYKEEIENLNSTIQQYTQQEEKLILKISELSFENMNLRETIRQYNIHKNDNQYMSDIQNIQQTPNIQNIPQQNINVKKIINKLNGYSSWN